MPTPQFDNGKALRFTDALRKFVPDALWRRYDKSRMRPAKPQNPYLRGGDLGRPHTSSERVKSLEREEVEATIAIKRAFDGLVTSGALLVFTVEGDRNALPRLVPAHYWPAITYSLRSDRVTSLAGHPLPGSSKRIRRPPASVGARIMLIVLFQL